MNRDKSAISSITAYECLDSRGFPTVSATVTLENGVQGTAMIPSGASTGEHEACELRDCDKGRYLGKGTTKALNNITSVIAPEVKGMDALDLASLDKKLIELDGTENKSRLGANAILAVSLASARAGAEFLKIPLFQHLGGVNARKLPVPFVNVINGGAHAGNLLDFQEFMLVPHLDQPFSENLRAVVETFHTLKANLKEQKLSTGLGDEGGFAPDLESSEAAIELLIKSITDAGYQAGKEISIALDIAASVLYDKSQNAYVLKKSSGKSLGCDDLIALYSDWISKYPIISIEDGLDENDWEGWTKMTGELGGRIQIVGDDIFVTNPRRLRKGIELKSANAILIKLNQIGTVTETLETVQLAHDNGFRCVISHRSGETEDTSIADFTVAVGAGQIKIGSVCRSERTAKYNRLLWIEKFLGDKAQFDKSFVKAG